jgi:hypothetical protein
VTNSSGVSSKVTTDQTRTTSTTRNPSTQSTTETPGLQTTTTLEDQSVVVAFSVPIKFA